MKKIKIKDFEYTNLIEKFTKEEKRRDNYAYVEDRKRASGSEKIIRLNANRKIKNLVTSLKHGNKKQQLLAKQILLEKEYVKALEKEKLRIEIERVLKCNSQGEFTLAEIGKVLGLTRERVRQIEAAGIKILRHPRVGQMLRNHGET